MAEAESSKRFRSPPYPAFGLQKAVERAKELYGKAHNRAVGFPVVADAWGYGLKSSGLWATVAALIHYGLITDEGVGDKRKFQLTEGALRIIRDPDQESAKRRIALQQAAIAPKIFRELWDNFQAAQTLSDMVLKSHLTVDRTEQGQSSFSDGAADEVIRIYRDSLGFAGLTNSDSIPVPPKDMDQAGDFAASLDSELDRQAMEATDVVKKDDFTVLMQGNRLKISAVVDAEGIARLKQVLSKYEEILKLLG